MTIGCNIMHDLFKICLIFLRSKSYVAISSMGPTFFGMRRLSQFSPYIDATDISKIKSAFLLSLYTLSFFANTPFKRRKQLII